MDDDQTKPVTTGDDFSEDTQNTQINPLDAELDAGIGEDALLGDDTDEETLTPDFPTDNPLETSSDLDEVDGRMEGKESAGDVINSLDLEDSEEEEAEE